VCGGQVSPAVRRLPTRAFHPRRRVSSCPRGRGSPRGCLRVWWAGVARCSPTADTCLSPQTSGLLLPARAGESTRMSASVYSSVSKCVCDSCHARLVSAVGRSSLVAQRRKAALAFWEKSHPLPSFLNRARTR
jgi:hypothetical protein